MAALVSPEALPDLRITVPSDEMTQRIAFLPEPERLRWEQAAELRRDVVGLKAAPGLDRVGSAGTACWTGPLTTPRRRSRPRGEAQVLVVGLLVTALLTLVLAAHLLVRRRAGPLTLARERGATLLGVGAELAVESLLVALVGAAVGIAVTAALVGSVGLALGAARGGGGGAGRPGARCGRGRPGHQRPAGGGQPRGPAYRGTAAEGAPRRAGGGGGRVGRPHLRRPAAARLGRRRPHPGQRAHVVGAGRALLLVRVLPPLVRLVLRTARRSAGRLRFFVAARVAAGGLRALPLVVVVVAVAQLVLGTALAATQQRGQESGALLAVGGDARLKTAPAREVPDRAAAVGEAPGVRVAVAGRVADRTLASSVSTGASVRLVVVDARAYGRLLAASDLPDAPQLERLTATGDEDAPVPALLLGGPSGLANGLHVRWGAGRDVALDVVGEAPRVDATTDPVIVVDAAAFAAAGAVADPDTIWAVGPGGPRHWLGGRGGPDRHRADYDEVLTTLRDAPLRAALVDLAVAGSLLLVLLAGLGVVLGAAVDAPARATALGRLRSLGLADRELRRVLAGELLVPVLACVLTGLVVGVATAWATFGSLGLEEVTGQSETPQLVVPLWTGLAALALPLAALVLAARQSSRLRRTNLAQLLRTGDSR